MLTMWLFEQKNANRREKNLVGFAQVEEVLSQIFVLPRKYWFAETLGGLADNLLVKMLLLKCHQPVLLLHVNWTSTTSSCSQVKSDLPPTFRSCSLTDAQLSQISWGVKRICKTWFDFSSSKLWFSFLFCCNKFFLLFPVPSRRIVANVWWFINSGHSLQMKLCAGVHPSKAHLLFIIY